MAQITPSHHRLILVIEDDPMMRNFIAAILKEEGHEVLVANNWNEAWEFSQMRNHKIDLFLSDIVMPPGSGMSAYWQIRTQHPDIKALFTAGRSFSPVELPEPWTILSKPFEANLLRSRVRELLASAGHVSKETLTVSSTAEMPDLDEIWRTQKSLFYQEEEEMQCISDRNDDRPHREKLMSRISRIP